MIIGNIFVGSWTNHCRDLYHYDIYNDHSINTGWFGQIYVISDQNVPPAFTIGFIPASDIKEYYYQMYSYNIIKFNSLHDATKHVDKFLEKLDKLKVLL